MDLMRWIDDHQNSFIEISDQVWEFAETRYQEDRSAALLADTLEKAGFNVRRGVADIPTALI